MGDSYYGNSDSSSNLISAMDYINKLLGRPTSKQQAQSNVFGPVGSTPEEYEKNLGEPPSQAPKAK